MISTSNFFSTFASAVTSFMAGLRLSARKYATGFEAGCQFFAHSYCAIHTQFVLEDHKAYDRKRMHSPNPVSFYKALGDLIRRRRKILNLSQEKLAGRLGVSRASIANIETGRQKILVHQLLQLAATLNLA